MTEFNVETLKKDGLYRQTTTITDGIAGSITISEPITVLLNDILRDESRPLVFGGQTTLMIGTPQGTRPTPFNWVIEGATTIEEAVDKFADSLKAALKTMEEAQLRQSLVTPGGVRSMLDMSGQIAAAKNRGPQRRN